MKNKSILEAKKLLFAILIPILCLFSNVPDWVIFLAVSLILFRLVIELTKQNSISGKIIFLLSLFLFAAVFVAYQTFLSLDAAACILILTAGVKLLDYNNDRDEKFLFLLGMLLISLKALYSYDLYWIFPLILSFYLLWRSLLQNNQIQTNLVSKIFLQALPLTFSLFIIFPRLIVPWATAKQTQISVVGFSDQLNPGQFEEIINQNKNVFNFHFSDNTEQHYSREIYWRGVILTKSNGMAWENDHNSNTEGMKDVDTKDSYTVYLEPQSNEFLFSLEQTFQLTSREIKIYERGPSYFISATPIRKLITYTGYYSFFERDRSQPLAGHLQIPILPPKTKKWIEKIKQIYPLEAERLQAVKDLFSDGSFFYTLKPGRYAENDLDEFLFSRRKGFCEHYAGSYATLVRALGIPSRVVMGYQGGTRYEYSDVWRVSSKDAHVWTEIYTNGFWRRVDPTSWVAPLRLELGGEAFFALPEDEQNLALKDMSLLASKNTLFWAYFQMTGVFQVLNFKWNQFLNDFDWNSQQKIFQQFKQNIGRFLLLPLLVIFLFYVIISRLFRIRKQESPLVSLFKNIQDWAQEQGFVKNSSHTPRAFLQQITMSWPDSLPFFNKFLSIYDQNLYRTQARPSLKETRLLVREWYQLKKKYTKH